VTTAGLLLAAGAGRRFGGPKALAVLGGEHLVQRGVRLLRDGGCAPVVAVLGAQADDVRAIVCDADVVVAPDWAEGMGASLRVGLAALRGTGAEACVVALVDQPLVTAEAVRRLLSVRPADAAVATYGGRPRNPVLLTEAVWHDVAALAVGDVGARAWIRAHPGRVVEVPCDDTGSPTDVDTADDLALLNLDPPIGSAPQLAADL
jgi:CTP:molybdopterin cytidylyltransferase MocA